MGKKDFKGGLDSLLGENIEIKKRGRPITSTRVIEKSSQEGIKEGETRATFIVKEDHLEKIKALAFWERKQIKILINEIIEDYLLNRKEAVNKAVSEFKKRGI
jgi:hypothetical protein